MFYLLGPSKGFSRRFINISHLKGLFYVDFTILKTTKTQLDHSPCFVTLHTKPDLYFTSVKCMNGVKGANNFRVILIAINYIDGSFNTVCPHFLKYESAGQ